EGSDHRDKLLASGTVFVAELMMPSFEGDSLHVPLALLIIRGISGEEVQGCLLPKSHGSWKTFPGPGALKTIAV
ncbi:hypothetical protein TorRG33x02_303680, partial [Trema orientale]